MKRAYICNGEMERSKWLELYFDDKKDFTQLKKALKTVGWKKPWGHTSKDFDNEKTHLPDAFDILEAWGAKYQCLLTWVKNVGFTPFSFMYSTEHCLFAHIGSLPLLQMGKRLDFSAKVREHSRKPDEFYDLVRTVSPGPRLDMFGREKHEGFDVWGNEPDKFTVSDAVEVK